jgi:phosphatidylserine decarboxylase
MKQTRFTNIRIILCLIFLTTSYASFFAQSYDQTWMPHDPTYIDIWTKSLCKEVKKNPQELIPPIQNLKDLVNGDPALKLQAKMMFKEAIKMRKKTPLGTPELKNFDEFLELLNAIMLKEPEFLECKNDKTGALSPCGLLGFPINALLNWPMGTPSGYQFFSNHLVNAQFKVILGHWSKHLSSPASREVLVHNDPKSDPQVVAWLNETAKKEVVKTACEGLPEAERKACEQQRFQDIFKCTPSDPYYGFISWDDYFTRTFKDGVRPVAGKYDDNIIANACESTPFRYREQVPENAQFWLKNQQYSLQNMMAGDSLATQFAGGTVYQAFLSALSFHRWNSPVSGTIKKAYVVDGSYYLENAYEGLSNPHPDSAAANNSQAFLTATATRAIIFIEADNPKIGLMCFMAVGMAEVSSCQITAQVGKHINKGEELGMFHFGGSTHCLIFRPETKLKFNVFGEKPGTLKNHNIPVNSEIARVVD